MSIDLISSICTFQKSEVTLCPTLQKEVNPDLSEKEVNPAQTLGREVNLALIRDQEVNLAAREGGKVNPALGRDQEVNPAPGEAQKNPSLQLVDHQAQWIRGKVFSV